MDPITDKEDVKYYAGNFYFQERKYKKAIALYREGLTMNPKSVLLLDALGTAYSEQCNNKEAVKCWKKLLRSVDPSSFIAVEIKRRIRSYDKNIL